MRIGKLKISKELVEMFLKENKLCYSDLPEDISLKDAHFDSLYGLLELYLASKEFTDEHELDIVPTFHDWREE